MAALRVLMIEDSALAMEVQLMVLERAGLVAEGVTDLDEMREHHAFAPDVVLTDVGLSDATVQEACEAIRSTFGSDVPILLYSGREDHELVELAASLGVQGFINKADKQKVVVERIHAAAQDARN